MQRTTHCAGKFAPNTRRHTAASTNAQNMPRHTAVYNQPLPISTIADNRTPINFSVAKKQTYL
ncbi:MAG: hypothetical protein PHE53_05795 [Thermoguttaceae bacterium]|nr:hypothetical protein [Thermoguttaceae bacterium]